MKYLVIEIIDNQCPQCGETLPDHNMNCAIAYIPYMIIEHPKLVETDDNISTR